VKTPDVGAAQIADSTDGATSPGGSPKSSSALPLGLLAVITGAAAVLRIHALAAKSFWFDEGVSVAIARLDWYNFARILWRREANMSLYYLLLRGWLHLGSSEFWIRALSVLFAVASIPVLYFLGKRLFDARVGAIASALLAVNAYHIQYSQEARTYPLMVLLCMISSLYFLKCLDDSSRRNRLIYILSSGLAVYAHFYSVLVVMAQWLSPTFLEQKEMRRRITNDWRWIGLGIVPIFAFIVATGTGPLRWVQRPSATELWDDALDFAGYGGPALLLACGVAVLAGTLPVCKTWRVRRVFGEPWKCRFLWIWLAFPPLLVVLISFVKPLFVLRYFISSLPAFLLLAASGIVRLRRPALIVPAVVLLIVLCWRGTVRGYQQDIDIQRDEWRFATHYLLEHAQPGDALIFHVPMGRMPYEFYRSLSASGAAAPVVLYPHHADHITFLDFVEKPDYPQLEGLLPQYARVWLVLNHARGPEGGPDQRSQELSQMLEKNYPHTEMVGFLGVEFLVYSRGEVTGSDR